MGGGKRGGKLVWLQVGEPDFVRKEAEGSAGRCGKHFFFPTVPFDCGERGQGTRETYARGSRVTNKAPNPFKKVNSKGICHLSLQRLDPVRLQLLPFNTP